ncbi:CGNR zinc finger domain-containing protein [Ochrobactrum sp. BTU1]|jgi:predicted RNA-binding Zn ribbon-like protein|uniref:CGNR zinc finger domain-containing protein n=1 Tax=Ochrobactrum sp. BTU1 TaxID=2840456 RepID=UPI001C03EF1E|nr:CGNR zinc finger domain-containing protein [Ochrobactrum sp. BTU1]
MDINAAKSRHPKERRKGSWRFLFRSDSVALNLVATVAASKDRTKGIDRFSEPSLLDRWLCEAELPPLSGCVTDEELAKTKALREAIFRLADNRINQREISVTDIALINAHARSGMPVLRIACDGCSTEPPDAAEMNEILGLIARDAIQVFTGPYRMRIKQCASPRCHVMFVDKSRAGNRVWCAMSPCGDQASARAYRRRVKKHNTLNQRGQDGS